MPLQLSIAFTGPAVLYKGTDPGVWAWHCHILNHAEGPNGMFGMVTALIVER